ncbi:3'(2'),5'-bisphosphate nucleotidase CysQ [Rhodovulum sp. DZ06]|uniref:3'(2'),5'-bisphosphate nucleotidase CysQ n=1 Tax=Rhodovulum sp. DZ06 TaxID=3425126 RepID=UPI003D332F34
MAGSAPAPGASPWAEDLALLRAAAEAAGEIALRHFRADPKSWDKEGGLGPVSEADLEVDEMLHARLLAARPDHGWLSEETEDDPKRLSHERVFIVDPIDGTRAFIAGEAGFSHALALSVDGKIRAAVVHLPAREETYWAVEGGGAFLNGARIAPSAATDPDAAQALISGPHLKAEHWPGGAPRIKPNFRPSLAWRLCLVAKGRFDAMVTFRPAWEWDVAAGDLIATEAGAVVRDRDGRPARYNAEHPRVHGMVAAAPGLIGPLLARMGAAG